MIPHVILLAKKLHKHHNIIKQSAELVDVLK